VSTTILRRTAAFLAVTLLLWEPVYGQHRPSPRRGRPPAEGKFHYVTVQIGAIDGPSISSYTGELNDFFASLGSSDRIDDFGTNFTLGLGVCASLSRHFSYQANLNLYSFETDAVFNYLDAGNMFVHRQELSLGGATFGLNFLLNPALEADTRFWPFLGVGVGVVSFFSDELMDATVNGQSLGGLSTRRTKIALGAGIVCGGVYKVSPRWGLIIQGEYLLSKAKMSFYLADDQELNLRQGLVKVGTVYFY
jgi:opacity protein-like surface antigen